MKKEDLTTKDIQTPTDKRPWKERRLKTLRMVLKVVNDQIQRVHQDEDVAKSNPRHYPKGSGKGGQFAPKSSNTPLSSSGATATKHPTRIVPKSKLKLAGSDEAHSYIQALFSGGKQSVDDISGALKKAGHKTSSGRQISKATIKAVIKRIDQQIKVTSKSKVEKIIGLLRSMGKDDAAIKSKLKTKGIKTESGRNVSLHTIRSVIKRIDAALQTKETPKTPVAPKTKELIQGMSMGTESVVYDYPKPFKSLDDARKWVATNLADKVTIAEPKDSKNHANYLENVNNTLAHIRLLKNSGIDLPRLNELEIAEGHSLDEKAAGLFFPSSNKIKLAVPSYKSSPGMTTYGLLQITSGMTARRTALETALQNKQAGKPPKTVDEIRPVSEINKMINRIDTQRAKIAKHYVSPQDVSKGNAPRFSDHGLSEGIFSSTYSYDFMQAGYLMHELGHAWHYSKSLTAGAEFGKGYNYKAEIQDWRDGDKNALNRPVSSTLTCTAYSATNTQENMAENFALYMNGQTHLIGDKFTGFFDNEFPGLNFGGTAKKTHVVKAEILDLLRRR